LIKNLSSGTGLGTCIEGSASGPLSGEGCPSERWFFTGEPGNFLKR